MEYSTARVMIIASLVTVSVLVSGRTARADEATALAKKHNAAAKKLFNLGMFHAAAAEYKEAYKVKPIADLLYNLAQCYTRLKRLEDLEQGLFYLKSYLRNAPFSPIRGTVDKETAALKKKIERLRESKRRPVSTPLYKTWWFWTAIGVVVTGATVAASVTAAQPDDPVMGTADPGIFYLP